MAEPVLDSQQILTREWALVALAQASRVVGFRTGNVELIRLGSNAVFRLNADVIARVAPSVARLANSMLQITISRWLSSVGYPAMRASDVKQPVEARGCIVTFWESVAPETKYAPIGQVAGLIRKLHDLPAPHGLTLPVLHPFGAKASPVPEFKGLRDEDAAFLRERNAWAQRTFPTLAFPLGFGVIHGDANVGNVLLDEHGDAVLIDLDSFSIGPRE